MSSDNGVSWTGVRFAASPPIKMQIMNKIFYLLLTVLCLACDLPPDPPAPQIKNSKDLGFIDTSHKIMIFSDDVNGNICYVVVFKYDNQNDAISCVKNEPPHN